MVRPVTIGLSLNDIESVRKEIPRILGGFSGDERRRGNRERRTSQPIMINISAGGKRNNGPDIAGIHRIAFHEVIRLFPSITVFR